MISGWEPFFVIFGSIATVALFFIILRQSKILSKQSNELEKTTTLAHTPFIIPRQSHLGGKSFKIVSIQNIGSASAKKINIVIRRKGKGYYKHVKIFGLTSGQPFPPKGSLNFSCTQDDIIEVRGELLDVAGHHHLIVDDYPIDQLVSSFNYKPHQSSLDEDVTQ